MRLLNLATKTVVDDSRWHLRSSDTTRHLILVVNCVMVPSSTIFQYFMFVVYEYIPGWGSSIDYHFQPGENDRKRKEKPESSA